MTTATKTVFATSGAPTPEAAGAGAPSLGAGGLGTHASLMALGFVDPVGNAQQCFRALLDALGQPGIPVEMSLLLPDFGLPTSAVATVLTLADSDTTLWLAPTVPDALRAYFRFHTGVRIVEHLPMANFALVDCVKSLPPLNQFNAGTALSPETSTTLILPVKDFFSGVEVTLDGPGFQLPRTVSPAGIGTELWEELSANHVRFPIGIDVVLCCETQVVGLPRSSKISLTVPAETSICGPGSDAAHRAERHARKPLFDAANALRSASSNLQEA